LLAGNNELMRLLERLLSPVWSGLGNELARPREIRQTQLNSCGAGR
jgi:hypothetical protein